MSSSFPSLQKSIRTCKVDTAWANKMQSDRFMNPGNMLCPVWQGVDTTGRSVCENSFWTKQGGCNSALDRVVVENELRPQYMEYVTLDAAGIRGDCQNPSGVNANVRCNRKGLSDVHLQTGQFGYQTGFQQNITPNCLTCPSNYGNNTNAASNIVESYIAMKQNQQAQRNSNIISRLML